MGWGKMYGRNRSSGYDNPPPPKDDKPRIIDGVKLFHGPMRFKFFGFKVFVSTGKQIGFISAFVMIIVMAFSLFATFSAISYNNNKIEEYKTEIANIETRTNLYLDIIEKANDDIEDDGYGKAIGVFKGQEIYANKANVSGIYKFNSSSYYIRYEITVAGRLYYYETFALYESVNAIKNKYTTASSGVLPGLDYVFNVAYKLGEDGLVEYAINEDFNNFTNHNLIEYQNRIISCEEDLKIAKISAGILIGIVVLIVALLILLIVKVVQRSIRQNKIERAKEEAEYQEFQARAEQAKAEINRRYRYCEYCGAKFPEDDDKCPSCGSVHFDIRR